MMVGAITLKVPQALVVLSTSLMTITFLIVIWNFAVGTWKVGTASVVADMQDEGELPSKDKWDVLLKDIDDIKNQAGKIEYLEHQGIELSAQLNNGIKDRLDDIVEDQRLATIHRTQMSAQLHELIGMFNQHFN